MDDLDDNLLYEILKRLPAKTVARFMIINKRFYSLISDPFFIVNHADYQSGKIASGFFHTSLNTGSIDHYSFDLSSPTQTISLDLPEDHQTYRLCILATCNGLILLMSEPFCSNSIYLCNPTTKTNRCIPAPGSDNHMFGIGLAVNPMAFQLHNHYKVVGLYRLPNCLTWQFKIFTPDTGCWRYSKETISYNEKSYLYGGAVYFRGALHWLTNKGDILAFDVDKEQSWMIKIPRTITQLVSRRPWFSVTWFGVVEDQLNLIAVNHKGIVNWVLCDYENKKWEMKRRFKRIWGKDNTVWILPLPIFYDGDRLVLKVARPFSNGYPFINLHDLQIHNLRTGGVSGGKTLEHCKLIPDIGTLIRV
ncbi:F-box domain [Macleaya cordata]|uniref:F-box domain n=1 Tax=Macleaya cordata TaxID=56857 RepID=A0A200Q4H4_MACCD|nr:F-box domain [Macleaya cordata]